MKLAAPLAALLLLSCGGESRKARAGEAIECAIGGAAFERNCTMERSEGAEGLTLTIRNAAGGFRRLLLPKDGSGAVAADGAEPARVSVLGDGRAEVAIGGDRYRLPVAIGPAPLPR
ncbi:MAG TPA: hypothetical protein VEW25_08210 [Allosphingosinicella sp.]|nr:hypothetical protein [Allosphingosinicella sp.]